MTELTTKPKRLPALDPINRTPRFKRSNPFLAASGRDSSSCFLSFSLIDFGISADTWLLKRAYWSDGNFILYINFQNKSEAMNKKKPAVHYELSMERSPRRRMTAGC
jgi:hypothetical protein